MILIIILILGKKNIHFKSFIDEKEKIEKNDFINEINMNNRNCFKNRNINKKDINFNNNNSNPIIYKIIFCQIIVFKLIK